MWMRGRQVDQPVQKLANLRSSIDVVAQPHYFGSFKRVSAHVREPLPQLLRFMQETVQVSHNNQAQQHCIAVGLHHHRSTERKKQPQTALWSKLLTGARQEGQGAQNTFQHASAL